MISNAKILAGLAVMAILLGLGGMAHAQSNIISFVLNASYTNFNSTARTYDGIVYPPNGGVVNVSQFYSLDITKASQSVGGSVYEVIVTPSTNITTSLQLFAFAAGNSSPAVIGVNTSNTNSPYNIGFILDEPSISTASGTLGLPVSYQEFFNYFNTHGPLVPNADVAWISDNSPSFIIKSINMTVFSSVSTNISLNSVGFTNGQFGFGVAGPAGSNVVVQASTNLQNWLPLATNTLTGGTNYFSDTNWTRFPRRFYRVTTQ